MLKNRGSDLIYYVFFSLYQLRHNIITLHPNDMIMLGPHGLQAEPSTVRKESKNCSQLKTRAKNAHEQLPVVDKEIQKDKT